MLALKLAALFIRHCSRAVSLLGMIDPISGS
jgi:hypothetical protein